MKQVVKNVPCRNCGEMVRTVIDAKLETVERCPKCIR